MRRSLADGAGAIQPNSFRWLSTPRKRLQSGFDAANRVRHKGVPATRRQRIAAAVVAVGTHMTAPYAAWIAADPFKGCVRVLITGPQGFERSVQFAVDEEQAEITRRVRDTLTTQFS